MESETKNHKYHPVENIAITNIITLNIIDWFIPNLMIHTTKNPMILKRINKLNITLKFWKSFNFTNMCLNDIRIHKLYMGIKVLSMSAQLVGFLNKKSVKKVKYDKVINVEAINPIRVNVNAFFML